MLIVEDHYHDWLTWADWFNAIGARYSTPRHALRTNSYELLMQSAVRGQGVSLGREKLLKAELASQRLVKALPHAMASRGRLYLMQPPHRNSPESVRNFCHWLLERANRERTSLP